MKVTMINGKRLHLNMLLDFPYVFCLNYKTFNVATFITVNGEAVHTLQMMDSYHAIFKINNR